MGLPVSGRSEQLLSKIATGDGHGENSSYFDGWKAYDRDPFHRKTNHNGVIQLGLAENQLCHDLMEDWIRENPKASVCTADGVSAFGAIANFQDYHGLPAFRLAITKFMEKVRGGRVNFDPDKIVMSGGATGAQELISFCLADPGDAFLIPTPYYPGHRLMRPFGYRITKVGGGPQYANSSVCAYLTHRDTGSGYGFPIIKGTTDTTRDIR